MKIKRIYEQEDNEKYYDFLGYDENMTDYLSSAYQLWSDAEGLEQLSADEHDTDDLNDDQIRYIDAFKELWEITSKFERKYHKDEFITNLKAKKYNL
jgi:hypothetical protein